MKKLYLLSVLPVFALTACNGLIKSDYAKFKEKVTEACKEKQETKQVKIKGTYDENKVDFTYDIPSSAGSVLDSALDVVTGKYNNTQMLGISLATAYKTPESFTTSDEGNENYTYYTGLGFKVNAGDATYQWNSKGLLSNYKDAKGSFSFSWVK